MGKGWSVIIVMITAAVAWLAVEKSAYTLAACAQIYEFILSLHQKISPCLPWLGLFCLFVMFFGLLWCVAYDSVFDARNNHMKKSFFCGILFSMALTTLAVISANFLDSERVLVVFGFLGIVTSFPLQFGACAIIAYTGDKPKKKKKSKRKDKPMVALEPNAWLFDGEYGGQYLVSGEQHKCARVLKVKDKETVKNTKRIGGLIGMVYRMFRAFAKAGLWIVIAVAAGLLGSAITNKVFKK